MTEPVNPTADMCCNCKHRVELRKPRTDKEAMERPGDLGCDEGDAGVNPTWKAYWCAQHERGPGREMSPESAGG